jgi:hypothetical protein
MINGLEIGKKAREKFLEKKLEDHIDVFIDLFKRGIRLGRQEFFQTYLLLGIVTGIKLDLNIKQLDYSQLQKICDDICLGLGG